MSWTLCKRNAFLRRLWRLGFVRRLLGKRCQSTRPYKDWADYFQRAPRATDDFVEAIAERRRDLLPLEERCRSTDQRCWRSAATLW